MRGPRPSLTGVLCPERAGGMRARGSSHRTTGRLSGRCPIQLVELGLGVEVIDGSVRLARHADAQTPANRITKQARRELHVIETAMRSARLALRL
jgi:hypothetical protein